MSNPRRRAAWVPDSTFSLTIPDGCRQQFLGGSWDATSVLLEAGDTIEQPPPGCHT